MGPRAYQMASGTTVNSLAVEMGSLDLGFVMFALIMKG